MFGYCSPQPSILLTIKEKLGQKQEPVARLPATKTGKSNATAEAAGESIVLAAQIIEKLGNEYLSTSSPEERRALREKYPGVFMRSGNVLTMMTSETAFQRYHKSREG